MMSITIKTNLQTPNSWFYDLAVWPHGLMQISAGIARIDYVFFLAQLNPGYAPASDGFLITIS